jgi:aromatic-L-amino-acid decarboxylase
MSNPQRPDHRAHELDARQAEAARSDLARADLPRADLGAAPLEADALDDGIDALREAGYAFVDLALDYFKGLEGRRVYGPVSPMGLDDLFAEPLPERGGSLADLVQECRSKVFPNTMAIGSRRYFGMMNPAPLPIGVLAELLVSAMNQNVASWRHAPAGTAIEKRVIRWLCDRFGLPETGFGTLIDGGSLANITGLKLAINRALGRHLSQLDNNEPPGPEMARLTFYMSDQGHYSFTKAVDLLGLGRGQLRKLPVDDLFRIDLAALEDAIAADVAAGLKPCCVIGVAGTTNTGSIDKLVELARIARRHDCWYHVDAAYGGAVILSDRFRPMLQGIEQADSITVDPHKWFYMPFSAGGILVREGDFLRQSFLVHPEYYMQKVQAGADGEAEEFDEFGRRMAPDPRGFHMGDKVNFFQYGVAGSRRFNGLKLWLALKLVGRAQFAAWIENDIYLAKVLAGYLRREPDFELLGPNTLGVCNFRWVPRNAGGRPQFNAEQTDRLNRQLQEQVEREGDAWFSYTILRGRVALRVNVENRRMRREHIERLVRVIRSTADSLLRELDAENP